MIEGFDSKTLAALTDEWMDIHEVARARDGEFREVYNPISGRRQIERNLASGSGLENSLDRLREAGKVERKRDGLRGYVYRRAQ